MIEKNILLTTKNENGETIVIRPYTSFHNVSGITEYVTNKLNQSYGKVTDNFVKKDDLENSRLDENDVTDVFNEVVNEVV